MEKYNDPDVVHEDRAGQLDRDEKHDPPAYENTKNGAPAYEDPFGDEEFAEVKYRTLAWWYVFLHWV